MYYRNETLRAHISWKKKGTPVPFIFLVNASYLLCCPSSTSWASTQPQRVREFQDHLTWLKDQKGKQTNSLQMHRRTGYRAPTARPDLPGFSQRPASLLVVTPLEVSLAGGLGSPSPRHRSPDFFPFLKLHFFSLCSFIKERWRPLIARGMWSTFHHISLVPSHVELSTKFLFPVWGRPPAFSLSSKEKWLADLESC